MAVTPPPDRVASLRVALAAAFLLAAILLGCYESPTPLADPATTPLDPRLIGRWRCVSPAGERPEDDPVFLAIARVSATEYAVAMGERDEAPDQYRALSARLEGVAVANVQEIDDEGRPGKWVLARYRLRPRSGLDIQIAGEKAFKGEGEGASARDIARRRLKAGNLFEPFCVCARMAATKN